MKVILSSETSVGVYQTACRNIPKHNTVEINMYWSRAIILPENSFLAFRLPQECVFLWRISSAYISSDVVYGFVFSEGLEM
jgi:hypothetical protein